MGALRAERMPGLRAEVEADVLRKENARYTVGDGGIRWDYGSRGFRLIVSRGYPNGFLQ